MSIHYLKEVEFLAPLDKESSDDSGFSVLTDRETIKGLAKRICDKLHHPVTILDINRLDGYKDKKNQSNIRIDSDIEYLALRDACKLLRRYAGDKLCHECDSFHAIMLKGMMRSARKEELEEKIENGLKAPPSFFVPSYKTEKGRPKILEGTSFPLDRLVIEYHCPILGYRELLFPIFFKNKVIGILFVGQSVVHEMKDTETIETIKEEFFSQLGNEPNKIFKEFIDEHNASFDASQRVDAGELRRRIVEADEYTERMERYLKPSKETVDSQLPNMIFNLSERYEEFICDVCKVLKNEEDDLEKMAEIRREKYFSTIVNEAVNEYFKIKTNTTPNEYTYEYLQEYLKNAWERFYLAKETIMKMLRLEEMILFGDGELMSVEKNKKKTIYTNNQNDRENRAKWSYDFSKLTDKKPLMYEPLISLDDDSILEGLYSTIGKTNVILLVYADVVIYLEVKDLEMHRERFSEMAKSIGRGLSRIYADIAVYTANFMKERYMLTLRMYRHESAHISARLNDNFEAYFIPDASRFAIQDNEKQSHIINDMQDATSLISHISKSIGIITGTINAKTIEDEEEQVDVISLLYKWQIMFRVRLSARNLDITVQRDYIVNAPRTITTNRDLFELLLYNLIDNAVKYAYRGSVIGLNWRYSPEDNRYFELSVSSYGPRMELGDRLYELYTRGNVHTDNIEGDGMGLYVIRRICGILGLEAASHTSDFISNYNIPLISWYLKESFDDPVHNKKKDELINFQKNISSDYGRRIRAVINNNENTIIRENLSQERLIARIEWKTYLTTFTVKIPVDMKYPS